MESLAILEEIRTLVIKQLGYDDGRDILIKLNEIKASIIILATSEREAKTRQDVYAEISNKIMARIIDKQYD
jgi:hypothetical protein